MGCQDDSGCMGLEEALPQIPLFGLRSNSGKEHNLAHPSLTKILQVTDDALQCDGRVSILKGLKVGG